MIENEIRLRVPDTEIDLRFVEDEWRTAELGMLVQRLERRIQRLPEVAASLRTDAQAATEEAARAAALLGRPWEHADELARLRRRQQELDEALMAPDAAPAREGSPSHKNVEHIRQRLDRDPAHRPASGISV